MKKRSFDSWLNVLIVVLLIVGLCGTLFTACTEKKAYESQNQSQSNLKEVTVQPNNAEFLYYSPTTNEVFATYIQVGNRSGVYNLHYHNYILYYSDDFGFYCYFTPNEKTPVDINEK